MHDRNWNSRPRRRRANEGKCVPLDWVLLNWVARFTRVDDNKGMYNGYILEMPRRIIDDMEKREIEKRGLSSLS
jgi:hypothetical protein